MKMQKFPLNESRAQENLLRLPILFDSPLCAVDSEKQNQMYTLKEACTLKNNQIMIRLN